MAHAHTFRGQTYNVRLLENALSVGAVRLGATREEREAEANQKFEEEMALNTPLLSSAKVATVITWNRMVLRMVERETTNRR